MAGAQLPPQVSGEERDRIFGDGGEDGLGGVGPRVSDAPWFVVGRHASSDNRTAVGFPRWVA